MGDAAYGDGDTRQTFADAGRTLIARVPGRPNWSHFPKEDFRIDLESGSCTCPAGQVTRTIVPAGRRTDQTGRTYRLEAFRFDAAVCGECPLRSQCLAAKTGYGADGPAAPAGSAVTAGPRPAAQRGLCRVSAAPRGGGAPASASGPAGNPPVPLLRTCQTRFQFYLAATVANLTLVAAKAGLTGETGSGPPSAGRALVAGIANPAAWLGQFTTLTLLAAALLTKSFSSTRGFVRVSRSTSSRSYLPSPSFPRPSSPDEAPSAQYPAAISHRAIADLIMSSTRRSFSPAMRAAMPLV